MKSIILGDRKIILSGDLEKTNDLRNLVHQIDNLEGVGAYKLSGIIGSFEGWVKWAHEVQFSSMGKPFLYDHQSLPDVGHLAESILRNVKSSGASGTFLKPRIGHGTASLIPYFEASKKLGVPLIVVGRMTEVIPGNYVSESLEFYKFSIQQGFTDLGVPANDLDFLRMLGKEIKNSGREVAVYPIGIGANYQGGKIKKVVEILGAKKIYPIIGREVYLSENPRNRASELIKELESA